MKNTSQALDIFAIIAGSASLVGVGLAFRETSSLDETTTRLVGEVRTVTNVVVGDGSHDEGLDARTRAFEQRALEVESMVKDARQKIAKLESQSLVFENRAVDAEERLSKALLQANGLERRLTSLESAQGDEEELRSELMARVGHIQKLLTEVGGNLSEKLWDADQGLKAIIDTQEYRGVEFRLLSARKSGSGQASLEFECKNNNAGDVSLSVSGSHNSSKTWLQANDRKVYKGSIAVNGQNSVESTLVPGIPFLVSFEVKKMTGSVSRIDVLDLGVAVDRNEAVLRFQGLELK